MSAETYAATDHGTRDLAPDGLDGEAMEAIAIVGMAGRFPGGEDLDAFWQLLRRGEEGLTFYDDESLLAAGVEPEVVRHPRYVKAKPVLRDVDRFAAEFFRCSAREALLMDPQHRLFLECAWQAMESSAHDPGVHGGRIGVFAAAGKNTYLVNNLLPQKDWTHEAEVFQLLLGNEKDYLAPRVAYKLGLEGPSLTVQTGCSSSLVAVHLACQSLLLGECDLALAGGISIDPPQVAGHLYRPGGVLSPDGHCRAFDAAAAGVTFGQGVGVVVLRKASEALADGDTLHALILGSAVNNDGSERLGFTAPSPRGQAVAIREALAVAGVSADTLGCVEAHGTGTALGDPIEVQALRQVFGEQTRRRGYCALGSVKTNIGHLGAAAGIAGLIKTVLALRHRELPASLHCATPNPGLHLAESPFFVNGALRPWESEGPRRAGVSSLGQGGTNAHLVLEEAPPGRPVSPPVGRQVLVVSAQTPTALERVSERLADHLASGRDDLADIAYSLQVGRRHFPWRRAVICDEVAEAIAVLRGFGAAGDGSRRDRPHGVFAAEVHLDSGHPAGGVPAVGPGSTARDADRARGLAERWLNGRSCDWPAHHGETPRRRLPLPTYPFERRRFWVDPPSRPADARHRTVAVGSPKPSQPVAEPEPVVETLVAILARALGIESVDPGADFFDLGGDSLSELQVRGEIEERLGLELPPGVLFDSPTAELLSARVEAARAGVVEGRRLPSVAETGKDRRLDPALRVISARPAEVPREILVTGASGLLGIHLVAELLARRDVRVHCLVRAPTVDAAWRKLFDQAASYRIPAHQIWKEEGRVVPVPGDLGSAKLGLGEAEYEGLAASLDAIYHGGAQVSFLQPYGALAPINVGGTRRIVRLAATGRPKAIHHMSSIAVFESETFAGAGRVSEDEDLSASRGFTNGYDLSKWVAEELLAEARRRGFAVSIYRLSNISGHSQTGIMAPEHIISALIEGCLELGLAPGEDNIINLLPVDAACRMVVGLSRVPEALGGTFHVVNPTSTRIHDVVDWLVERGHPLRSCGDDAWHRALRASGTGNAFHKFLPLLDEGPLFSNRVYAMERVRQFLPEVAALCPAFDGEMLDRLLDRLLDHGLRTGHPEPAATLAIAGRGVG